MNPVCELAFLRAVTVAQAILYFSSPVSSRNDDPQPPHKPGPGAFNVSNAQVPDSRESNFNCFRVGGKQAA